MAMMFLNFIAEDGTVAMSLNDISIAGNTKYTVELLNQLPNGTKVKAIEITFTNAELKGETAELLEDRQIILSGVRVK